MARASRSPNRFSLPPNAFHGFDHTEQRQEEPTVYQQLQKKYSDQNRTLAQTTVKLQCQNTELETELATAQREIRTLKIQNEQLINLIRGKIVNFQDKCNNEFQEILSSLGSEVSVNFKRTKTSIPFTINENINEDQSSETVKVDYLKQMNQDFRKRKSALFVSSIPEEDETLLPSVQNLSFVEEIKEPESEPEYIDTESKMIPIKRKRDSQLFNTSGSLKPISYLPPIQDNIPNLGTGVEFQSKKLDPNEAARISSIGLFNNSEKRVETSILEGSDDDFSISKEQESINPFIDSLNDDGDVGEVSTSPTSPMKKKTKRSRIPRELKNLDTEKTKRWSGVDPLDGRSRRSSMVPRYDIPVKAKTRKINVFNDNKVEDDEEVQIIEKPRTILGVKDSNVLPKKQADTVKNKDPKDMSIFDLEKQDFLDIAIPLMPMEGKNKRRRPKKNIDNFVL